DVRDPEVRLGQPERWLDDANDRCRLPGHFLLTGQLQPEEELECRSGPDGRRLRARGVGPAAVALDPRAGGRGVETAKDVGGREGLRGTDRWQEDRENGGARHCETTRRVGRSPRCDDGPTCIRLTSVPPQPIRWRSCRLLVGRESAPPRGGHFSERQLRHSGALTNNT